MFKLGLDGVDCGAAIAMTTAASLLSCTVTMRMAALAPVKAAKLDSSSSTWDSFFGKKNPNLDPARLKPVYVALDPVAYRRRLLHSYVVLDATSTDRRPSPCTHSSPRSETCCDVLVDSFVLFNLLLLPRD